jgi:hypothetical protein
MQQFNWVRVGNKYHVDTPHGRAIISEQPRDALAKQYGVGLIHKVYIEHITGVRITSPESFSDFMAAEQWIIDKITALDNPRGDEMDLENLLFTLEICRKALPPDTHPAHFTRIDLIKEILSMRLL